MTETAKRIVCAALLGALVVVLTAAPASAAKSCGQKVVDDWYGNGVVDGVYPLHCYRDALKLLPDDVQTYSSAPDDIKRAQQTAIRNRQQTGTPPPSPSPPSGEPTSNGTNQNGIEQDPDDTQTTTSEVLGGIYPEDGNDGGLGNDNTPPSLDGDGSQANGSSGGVAKDVLESIGPESADALPLPVLIVAGLAILLLAAGSAGLVARRLQARKVRSDPPAPPGRPGV